MNEISEEFEELQRKVPSASDDKSTQPVASEAHSIDGVVGESLEVNGNDGMDREGPEFKLETKEPSDLGSELEHCLQKQVYLENQDDNHSLSPPVSLGKRNKLSSNYNNLVKDSPSVSSPSHHSLLKEEGPLDVKVKSKYSSDGLNELTNGHRTKPTIGSKKKPESAMHSRGSAVRHEPSGEVKHRKFDSSGSEKKEKRLTKEKRHSERADDGQEDAELDSEELNGVISRKRLKSQHGREKQGPQTNEASKFKKKSDIGDDANLIKAQTSRKHDSRSPNIFNGKVFRRLTSVTKAEACRPLRVPISPVDASHSSDEDDFPPTKRHRRSLETTFSSALISDNDLVLPDKVRSPVPIKRRSVRLCDDEDDESQKTPIHGGITSKVSLIARVSDSKNKPTVDGESCVDDPLVLVNKGQVDEPIKVSSPAAQQGVEKRTSVSLALKLDSEKLPSVGVKSVPVSPKRSPQSVVGGRASAELHSKHSNKASGGISRKKTPAGDNKSASTIDRSTSFPSKQASLGDKKKATSNSDLKINDSVPAVRTSNER